jgi:hypothetical protein
MIESLVIEQTAALLWIPQQDRPWTELPDGDVELEAFTTEGYRIYGVLTLASEALTFIRADELAEYYTMVKRLTQAHKIVYCQHDVLGSFYLTLLRPFIKKFVGDNQAILDVYGKLEGDITTLQEGFQMMDLDIVSNEWNL